MLPVAHRRRTLCRRSGHASSAVRASMLTPSHATSTHASCGETAVASCSAAWPWLPICAARICERARSRRLAKARQRRQHGRQHCHGTSVKRGALEPQAREARRAAQRAAPGERRGTSSGAPRAFELGCCSLHQLVDSCKQVRRLRRRAGAQRVAGQRPIHSNCSTQGTRQRSRTPQLSQAPALS
jgi:hypothetical protein